MLLRSSGLDARRQKMHMSKLYCTIDKQGWPSKSKRFEAGHSAVMHAHEVERCHCWLSSACLHWCSASKMTFACGIAFLHRCWPILYVVWPDTPLHDCILYLTHYLYVQAFYPALHFSTSLATDPMCEGKKSTAGYETSCSAITSLYMLVRSRTSLAGTVLFAMLRMYSGRSTQIPSAYDQSRLQFWSPLTTCAATVCAIRELVTGVRSTTFANGIEVCVVGE